MSILIEILEKTKLSQEELDVVLNFLEEQIEVIPFEEFEDKYDFAQALKLNCAIWTNDKKLKEQNAVKVYTTHEIMQMLEIY